MRFPSGSTHRDKVYAFSHCTSVRMMHKMHHKAARWEQVRIWRPRSLCAGHLLQHMRLVTKNAIETLALGRHYP